MSRLARTPRSVWVYFALVAGAAVLVGGWTAASRSSAGSLPAAGGRYVEGSVGPRPERINPLFAASSGPERDLTALVFSGLTRPGPDGQPEPDLADSWVASTDGTSFTFNLRRDVTWHDGQPFTADDVVFTASAFAAPGVRGDPATAEVWRRAHVQKLATYAVLFQFDAPFAPFLAYSSTGILPSHLLAKHTPQQLVDDPFNRHPVGTGPFVLQSLSATAAVLTPNPAYQFGAPYLKHLSLRFLSDQNALLDAIRSRKVDGGILPPPLSSQQLDALRASGHALISGLRPSYDVVYLNLNLAQFQDPAVRRALSLATDRGRLVQQVMDGQATAADVPLPPGSWPDSGPGTSFAPDPAAARKLLADAGWTQDPSGVMRRRGITLSFTIQTTPDPQRTALANALAQQWSAIGVQAKVQTADANSLLNDVLLPHKYEAVLYGWDPGPDPDPFTAWHSSQRGESGRNLSGYASLRADQLLESLRQATDPADRTQLYAAFAGVFRDDVPALVLYYPRDVYAVPAGLQDVRLGTLASTADRFATIAGWSLESRRN